MLVDLSLDLSGFHFTGTVNDSYVGKQVDAERDYGRFTAEFQNRRSGLSSSLLPGTYVGAVLGQPPLRAPHLAL